MINWTDVKKEFATHSKLTQEEKDQMQKIVDAFNSYTGTNKPTANKFATHLIFKRNFNITDSMTNHFINKSVILTDVYYKDVAICLVNQNNFKITMEKERQVKKLMVKFNITGKQAEEMARLGKINQRRNAVTKLVMEKRIKEVKEIELNYVQDIVRDYTDNKKQNDLTLETIFNLYLTKLKPTAWCYEQLTKYSPNTPLNSGYSRAWRPWTIKQLNFLNHPVDGMAILEEYNIINEMLETKKANKEKREQKKKEKLKKEKEKLKKEAKAIEKSTESLNIQIFEGIIKKYTENREQDQPTLSHMARNQQQEIEENGNLSEYLEEIDQIIPTITDFIANDTIFTEFLNYFKFSHHYQPIIRQTKSVIIETIATPVQTITVKLSKGDIMKEAHKRAKTYEGNYSACLSLAMKEIFREQKEQPTIAPITTTITTNNTHKRKITRKPAAILNLFKNNAPIRITNTK